jgi:hypothetical protein
MTRHWRELDSNSWSRFEKTPSQTRHKVPCPWPARAAGYLSSLIGNLRLSGYLERHHPEIVTEFRAIVAATSLEESDSGASEERAFLS